MPNLGFIISNQFGINIFGTNTLYSSCNFPRNVSGSGDIIVKIKQPKLINGKYRLSLWFGDDIEDFCVQKDCFSFEVINMKGGRQPPTNFSGDIFTECEWSFNNIEN
jgi:hypothetical protein